HGSKIDGLVRRQTQGRMVVLGHMVAIEASDIRGGGKLQPFLVLLGLPDIVSSLDVIENTEAHEPFSQLDMTAAMAGCSPPAIRGSAAALPQSHAPSSALRIWHAQSPSHSRRRSTARSPGPTPPSWGRTRVPRRPARSPGA